MKKILIVVDMQKDFISGALGTPEAVGIVDKVTKKIKSFDGDIIVTFDTHYENYMETAEGKKLPVMHCIKGSEGWELDEAVNKALTGKEVYKLEKPTFGSVKLPEIINQKYDVNDIEIELIGVCTDICVVSNALLLKAHFPQTVIRVDSSCCAGVSVQSHNAALTTMQMCQIDII